VQIEFRECSHHSVQNLLHSSLLYKNIMMKVYRILIVGLYGCETSSLTFREERRLRVFENSVLRSIFDPKRDEVTRERRKLHTDEPNYLHSSPSVVRMIKLRRM